MDIDKAVEQAADAAFTAKYEAPEVARDGEATCIVCGEACVKTDSGWVKDAYLDSSDGVPYWTGTDLATQADTPWGFVCSTRCQSQAIYEHASEAQKRKLRMFMDGCRAIVEVGYDLGNNPPDGMNSCIPDDFLERTAYILEDFGDDSSNPPAWLNCGMRSEDLTMAVEKAADDLWLPMMRLGVEISVLVKNDHFKYYEWLFRNLARNCASIANVITNLKAATKEGE